MTTAVSEALSEYFSTHSFLNLTTTASAIAIAVLLFAVVERELIRAVSPEGQRRNVAAFFVIIIPMAVTFIMVIVARFIQLA